MKTVSLITTKRHRFRGTAYNPGDKFDAGEKEARILVAIGRAQVAPAEKPVKPAIQRERTAPQQPPAANTTTLTIESEDPAKKREYLRRDMKAED